MKKKNASRHIWIKQLKIKDKEKTLKASRKKMHRTFNGTMANPIMDFLNGNRGSHKMEQWRDMLKGKTNLTRTLHLSKDMKTKKKIQGKNPKPWAESSLRRSTTWNTAAHFSKERKMSPEGSTELQEGTSCTGEKNDVGEREKNGFCLKPK